MRSPVHFAFAAACAALMQSACVASPAPMSCSISGQKHLPQAIEAGGICAAFSARLNKALAERGASGASDNMAFALTLNGRGTIEVRAIAKGDAPTESLPNAAVDVMDREIKARDFDQLADTLADVLAE